MDILKSLGASIDVLSTPLSYAELADLNGEITAIEAYNTHEDKKAPLVYA